ncbi:MAG: amino-acid N-acetyltransferase [Candidatus Nanopelagicales bacterium]
MSTVTIRPARTPDVQAIRRLVGMYTDDGRLLAKAPVTLYEDVQEFLVAEVDGEIVGCGALHVMWEDLGEIRTLAVDPGRARHGVGGRLLDDLIARARALGLARLFCLTFEMNFFASRGFTEIEGSPVDHAVFEQLLQSYDEGVAEFLDLERVKPNTLGNHRMLMVLR